MTLKAGPSPAFYDATNSPAGPGTERLAAPVGFLFWSRLPGGGTPRLPRQEESQLLGAQNGHAPVLCEWPLNW